MKTVKLATFILLIFFLNGCSRAEQDASYGTESSVSVEATDEMMLSQEDIISAFRFWLNYEAWRYGDRPIEVYGDYYEEHPYIGKERQVEIYYGKGREDFYSECDLGYLYFPFQENDETLYKQFMFAFGEEGFYSSPGYEDETIKSISKKLEYLGTETFYFAKDDVSKPVYPASSAKKEKVVAEFKQAILDSLYSNEHAKGKFRIYIENFTNEDMRAEVLIIYDDNTMGFGCVGYHYVEDGASGMKKVAGYQEYNLKEPRYWDDELDRAIAEKTIQISVCDFEVTIP